MMMDVIAIEIDALILNYFQLKLLSNVDRRWERWVCACCLRMEVLCNMRNLKIGAPVNTFHLPVLFICTILTINDVMFTSIL